MAELKRIIISLPDNLLKEVDNIASVEKTNRSKLIREAMRLYILQRQKIGTREGMKKGYEEMAEINVKFAEMCLAADNEQSSQYEELLGEMEG